MLVDGRPSQRSSLFKDKRTSKAGEAPDAVEKLDKKMKQQFELQETKVFVRGVGEDEVVGEAEISLEELVVAKQEEVIEEEDDPIAQEEQFLVAEYVSTHPFPR